MDAENQGISQKGLTSPDEPEHQTEVVAPPVGDAARPDASDQPGAASEVAHGARLPSWAREALFFGIAVAVFAADYLTKLWVRTSMFPGQSIPPDAPVRLTYITNTGSAFGLFQNQTIFLVITAVIGIGAIILYHSMHSAKTLPLTVSLGLQLGGAAGNLVERMQYGRVTDFIDLRFWPVFNVADSSIVVGVALLAWLLFMTGKEKPTQ